MLRIGEFARLGDVTVRALRHYDEVGLIIPSEVDPTNGYRRYSVAQLRELNRIVALRELGFPLPEIKQLLAGMTEEGLRELLTERRAQLARALERDQVRLSRIEARLHALDSENDLADDVVVKNVASKRYVALEGVVPGLGPATDTEHVTFSLRVALRDAVEASSLPVEAVPALTCFMDRDDEEELTVFVGIPASDDIVEVEAPMQLIELPGATVAACVRTGHLHGVWPKIADDVYLWLYSQGYTHAGIGRTFTLEWNGGSSDNNTFEIHVPIYGPGDPVPAVDPLRL